MYQTPETRARVAFELPPSPLDFAYYHCIAPNPHANLVTHQVLSPAFQEVHERYGIELQSLKWGEVPKADGRIPYILIAGVNPLEWFDSQGNATGHSHLQYVQELSSLAKSAGARINMVTTFPYNLLGDSNDYKERASQVIPYVDRSLRVNTIFADNVDGLYYGVRTITARDLADNIVCETIRVKYTAIRESNVATQSALELALKRYGLTISELQRIFEEYRLYHRAPTDGAIAIRARHGWLVSQTKTDKTTMTSENFSWVNSYSTEKNSINYEGPKLPSSDAPEFLEALHQIGELEEGTVVVHFHKNEITRGNIFPEHTTRNIIEYGRFESAREIASEMGRIGDNWLILREHGLVWVGKSTKEFENFILNILKLEKD